MPRRKRVTAEPPADHAESAAAAPTAPETAPPPPAQAEPPAEAERPADPAAPPAAGEEHPEFKLIQGRYTSTVAGVEAGVDFNYAAQPYVAFDDARPATPEEKQELQSQGEGDPHFKYRGSRERRWTGPSTADGREKAETLAERFAAERLKKRDIGR